MTAAEVLIKIRTFFEGSGSQQADASLQKTAAQAKKTGQEISQSGQKGSDGLNMMSVATAAMQGNMQAAANAAVPLLEKSKAAGLSLTQLSLAGAGLSAVIAGLKAMSEWADAAAQRVASIQMGNLTNQLNASAAAYEKLLDTMAKAEAQKDATLAYNNSMIDSYTRQALAVNKLNKEKELSLTTDDSKRRDIEAKYASQAEAITGMSDTQKEANEKARSLEREATIEKRLQAAANRRSELIGEASDALKQGQNSSMTARDKLGFWSALFSAKGSLAQVDSWRIGANTAGALSQKSIDLASDEEKRIEALKNEMLEVRRQRSIALSNSIAGSTERIASGLSAQRESSDRQRSNQEEMYKEGERFQANLQQFHPSDQSAIIEEINRMAKNGELTLEALRRRNEMDERIIKAYQDAESRQRNF